MILKRFSAENFRNIEICDIEFSGGVNLLIGSNAQGKTNSVEGINMFAQGRSFRGSEDKDLVRFGEAGFRIKIEYEDKNGDGTLEYALFGKERLRKKNSYKLERVSQMIGSFRCVIFYPDNLSIVKDGPEYRRAFLNNAISQCYPEYIKYYASYKKALENRNCILKFASKGLFIDDGELYSWSESMAEYASYIYAYRKDYIDKIKVHTERIMKEISSDAELLTLDYISDIECDVKSRADIKAEYIRILTSSLEKEKAQGVGLFGPHRDDIDIKINGKSARSFASQGQKRSAVLAIKLAEGEVSREIFGEYPVFLFDDVLSELDDKRKKYILEKSGEKQIIITSCDEDIEGINAERIIRVERGSYVSSCR